MRSAHSSASHCPEPCCCCCYCCAGAAPIGTLASWSNSNWGCVWRGLLGEREKGRWRNETVGKQTKTKTHAKKRDRRLQGVDCSAGVAASVAYMIICLFKLFLFVYSECTLHCNPAPTRAPWPAFCCFSYDAQLPNFPLSFSFLRSNFFFLCLSGAHFICRFVRTQFFTLLAFRYCFRSGQKK